MALTTIKAAAMAANSIDSDQYVDGSVDTAHIGDDQVTAAKLADAINTDIAAKAPLASPAFTGSPTTVRLTAGSATTTGFYSINATTNSTLGSGWSALYARNATAGGRAIGVLNAGATAETVTILENGDATFAGTVTAANVSTDGQYIQQEETLTVSSNATTVNCSTGNYFTVTASGNITFTFGTVPADTKSYAMVIEVNHDSGTLTWPAAVKWPADTAPTLTAGKTHQFYFHTNDNGSRWRGASLVDYVD